MKRLVFIVLLLFISSIARAAPPTFADIQWGASEDEVRKQLASNGFVPGALDKDGDFKFEDQLFGFKAKGLAFFADKKIAKFIVGIITPENKAIDTYRSMKDVLLRKYGTPTNDFEFFEKPYYYGDGYETQAIRLGKANFACFWSGLLLEIHESLAVQVSYESDAWSAEVDKRKARAAGVF